MSSKDYVSGTCAGWIAAMRSLQEQLVIDPETGVLRLSTLVHWAEDMEAKYYDIKSKTDERNG